MAQRQRQRGSRRTPAHARHKDNEGIVPVLARAVRELESAVQRGPLAPGQRVRFQVVALLVREHRGDVRASTELTDAQKADELKRLDGIATILAKTATRDPSLFGLLSEDSVDHRQRPRPAPRDAPQGRHRGRRRGAQARRRVRPRRSASGA